MAAAHRRQWIPLQKQLQPGARDPANLYQRNARRRRKEAIEKALKKGYLKCLDRELILGSQLKDEGTEELEDVLRISLRGCHVKAIDDIAILTCARLRICNLESCYISNITAFYGCVNLLKLDVSNNQIEVFPPHDFWASLSSLRVLYLSGNAVSRREGLERLNGCPELHVLTLHETPLSLTKSYRHHVVNSILSLRALDHHVISDEEIIENLHTNNSTFTPMTNHFQLQLHKRCAKGVSYHEELQAVYSLLLAVDRVLATHSPVMIIQRWVRGWLVRKALDRSSNPRIRSFLRRSSVAARPQVAEIAVPQKNLLKPGGSTTLSTKLCTLPQPTPPRSQEQNQRAPKCHSGTYAVTTLPPPPPTSPKLSQLPVETHILGMDAASSKMKYTMHINLGKLQQKLTDAENFEPEGINKAFKSTFRYKGKPNTKGQKVKLLSPRKGRDETETLPKSETSAKDADVLTSDSLAKSVQLPEAADSQAGGEVEGESIEVMGHSVRAVPCDRLTDIVLSKKEDGKRVRIAEKEIKEGVEKAKEQPSKPREVKESTRMSKDELFFTRAYATMTLSALRAVERMHEARKKADALIQKANLVSQMKQERMERKEKIEKSRRDLKENIITWKITEEDRLERMREQILAKTSEEHLSKSQCLDTAAIATQRHAEDQKFACEFSQHNTLVGNMICREDQKLSKNASYQERKERVEWMREVSREQQEAVKRSMELREAKLLQECATARKELDTKMLQAASQRMMEAKTRVAKEVARKQAARAAIATSKEGSHKSAPRSHPPVYHESTTAHPQNVELQDKLSPLWKNAEKQGPHSPVHVRKMSRESHRTWQRGSQVLTRQRPDLHFPILATVVESPLMYNRMHPGPTLQGHTDSLSSPRTESRTDSCPELNSPGDKMIVQQQQQRLVVR